MTRFYDTADWQKIRARQLGREPICEGCTMAPATLADHIVPIRQGGAKRDPSNLQSLCRDCHAGKSAADLQGKQWTPPKFRGCYPDGSPRDPAHPWHTGAGSASTGSAATPAASLKTELVFENGSKQWD